MRPAAWPAADSGLAAVAMDSAGQSLAGYLTPRLVRQTRASGLSTLFQP